MLSALVKYEYCMDGPGRGLPYAMSHPGHGPELLEFAYQGAAAEGIVFDAASASKNVVVWSLFVGLPLALVDLRSIRTKSAGS